MKPRKNLLSLNAKPSHSQLLYHYCSSHVLWSIIEGGNIWLSDILTLNDAEEIKWGTQCLLKVLLNNPTIFYHDFRDFVISMVLEALDNMRPFVGSFSAVGDLLSQWRAYSEDGRGFTIGLKAADIHKKWGVRLKRVEYREARQEALIKQSLLELHEIWRTTGGVIVPIDVNLNPNIFPNLGYPTPVHREIRLSHWLAWAEVLAEFAMDLASFKHPTFSEEKEFRVIRAISHSDGKYADVGARSKGGPLPIRMRMRGSAEIAYIEYPLDKDHDGTIISEVIMGPKNLENIDAVQMRIEKAGFHHVRVRKSSAPYR